MVLVDFIFNYCHIVHKFHTVITDGGGGMRTKIIAVVNQKGGCGKTTITMQLAGTLGRRGQRVLVVERLRKMARNSQRRWLGLRQQEHAYIVRSKNM